MDIPNFISTISDGVGIVDSVVKTIKGVKDLTKGEASKSDNLRAVHDELSIALEKMVEIKRGQLQLLETATELRIKQINLDDRVAKLNRFEMQSKNYILRTIAPHSHVYAEINPDAEQSRYACVQCFDQGEISLLQIKVRDFNFDTLKCPRCAALVQSPNDNKPAVIVARRSRGFWDDY